MIRILLIGAVPNNSEKSIGGTTILVRNLMDFLSLNNIYYNIIPTNRFVCKLPLLCNFIYVLFYFIIKIYFHNVIIINASKNSAFYLSPLLFILTKLFDKKIVFRMFGGNLDVKLEQINSFIRYVFIKTVMRADLIFLETMHLVNIFSKRYSNIQWLPNSRKKRLTVDVRRRYSKRFVFIGLIKRTKGIDEILKVSGILDKDYIIDFYGPCLDSYYNISVFDRYNVNYKGVLKPNKVLDVLNQYDVILLPTYYEGEGYPGIIIEGYSLGIPCITTRWRAVPEIVEDRKTGILIEPKNEYELLNAILSFNSENYEEYSKNCIEKFEQFENKYVHTNFFNIIKSLIIK